MFPEYAEDGVMSLLYWMMGNKKRKKLNNIWAIISFAQAYPKLEAFQKSMEGGYIWDIRRIQKDCD
jgi:hypothetical protein